MKKNTINLIVIIVSFIFSTSYGQKSTLRGRVVDESNQPLQGAFIRLTAANKEQTTNGEGRFSIDIPSMNVLPVNRASNVISCNNGILSFTVFENQQRVLIEVFDNKGQRIKQLHHGEIGKGTHTIPVLPDNVPAIMCFVKVQLGNRLTVFNVLYLENRRYVLSGKRRCLDKSFLQHSAAITTAIDTLRVSKPGYDSAQLSIYSYNADIADIILDSIITEDEGLPPIVNGKNARTTRYWDCCKPHCGWHSTMRMCDSNGDDLQDQGAQSGCSGGPSFQCWDYAPLEINSKISYGWAAFNNQGTQCGDCFQLDFQGVLEGKQMIVQVINIGDGGSDAFDLLIPGGGVGALNGCSRQWGNVPLGTQYGGFHSTCGDNKNCIRTMCQQAFGDKEDLMRGCEWYLNWFQMNSNPNVIYIKVPCPQEIKDISRIGN